MEQENAYEKVYSELNNNLIPSILYKLEDYNFYGHSPVDTTSYLDILANDIALAILRSYKLKNKND
uniref:Uncharacterized protein n=1 Tax=viral metagenome TaxID=1070528 RepID=A0A6C0EM41_9ZZZZ